MMLTYFGVVKNEIRLLWRRKSFWIVQGLLSLLPILIAILMFIFNIRGPLILGSAVRGLATIALYYLVFAILVGPAILNDLGKIGEILWSSPLDGLAHFTGVFTGLWLALLPGSLFQLAGWFLADLFWPNLLSGWTWLLSLAFYLLANTLGLCLTFLLAMLVRRILPLLISWAALWVWIYFSVAFSEAWTEGFNPMHTIAYINIFFHNLLLSPSLGLGLARGRVLGMLAWFLGISLAALGLALMFSLLADRRRAVRRNWLPHLLVVISLFAAVVGYAINARAITANAIPPSPFNVQIDAWNVLSQHTEVEVDASSGLISGTALLTLSPRQVHDQPTRAPTAEIVLCLNTGLALTAASDGAGKDLSAHRVGDSLVISLPAVPTSPFTLNLTWKGHLQIPYTVFEQQWKHYDAPYPYGFTHMPKPLKALVQPAGGYMLRDGDWMPWPWSSVPHQADENTLVIRPTGGEAVASIPLQGGAAAWESPIPEGLLVFLPDHQVKTGAITLAASPLLGNQYIQQAGLFVASAGQLASLFNAPPPRYVVVVPYLSELVWSGDLLLIPDGSGYYTSKPMEWLYQRDVTSQDQPIIARATLAALARAWLIDRLPPVTLEFQPLFSPPSETPRVVEIASISEQEWLTNNGHWVQASEFFDILTTWDPRRVVTLSPQGEWSAVAFWLAMELADEPTRQADLDLLAYFAGEGQNLRSGNQRYALMSGLLWPSVLDSESGRAIVRKLHNWAALVGPREAIAMLAAVVQESRPKTVGQLITALEQPSGLPILKEQP